MTAVVIMAAGKGTRMNSDLPKVLHRIRDRPLIDHVLATARQLHPERLILIVGHNHERVMAAVTGTDVEFVVQEPQLGTGHAVMQVLPLLNNFAGEVVILSGDVPLLQATTLLRLIFEHRSQSADVTVLSTIAPDPSGYGRIIRNGRGKFIKIVEHRDATPDELCVREINSGIYCFNAKALFQALADLRPENAKGEYYLTDAVHILNIRGRVMQAVDIADFWEVCGINTMEELHSAEAALAQRKVMP